MKEAAHVPREFWDLLHEWSSSSDEERRDWIEHRFGELFALAYQVEAQPAAVCAHGSVPHLCTLGCNSQTNAPRSLSAPAAPLMGEPDKALVWAVACLPTGTTNGTTLGAERKPVIGVEAAEAAIALIRANLPACVSSEASGSAIPARPTLPGEVLSALKQATDALVVLRARHWTHWPEADRSLAERAELAARAALAGEVSREPITPEMVEQAARSVFEFKPWPGHLYRFAGALNALLARGDQKAPAGEPLLSRVLRCRYPVSKSLNPSGFDWDTSRLNEVIAEVHPSSVQAVDGDENAKLRQLLCDVLTALGNGSGASPICSMEFLSHIPEEVRLQVAALRDLGSHQGKAPG